MRRAVMAVLGLVVLVGAAAAQTQDAPPTTAAERKEIVQMAKKLEQNPVDRSLTKDERRLFQRIIDVPDVTVTLCNDVMPWLQDDYKYAPELSMAYTFGAAAYVIEHPAADPGASSWAGIESALRGYQNMVKKDGSARSAVMERALDMRDMGTLEQKVKEACGPEKQRL